MYRYDTLLFRLLLRIEHSRRFLLASIKHRRRIRFLLERGRPLSTATCWGFFFFNLSALALPAIDKHPMHSLCLIYTPQCNGVYNQEQQIQDQTKALTRAQSQNVRVWWGCQIEMSLISSIPAACSSGPCCCMVALPGSLQAPLKIHEFPQKEPKLHSSTPPLAQSIAPAEPNPVKPNPTPRTYIPSKTIPPPPHTLTTVD